MRCNSCHKNFDYDKYYGICPKCGSFNQRETREARHEELHDRFGDKSVHRRDSAYDTSYEGMQERNAKKVYASGSAGCPAEEGKKRRAGIGLLVFSIVFLMTGFGVLVSGTLTYSSSLKQKELSGQSDNALEVVAHEEGEAFDFQHGSLQIMEAKVLADQEQLPDLADGMRLVAVRVRGQSNGEYEDYNLIAQPYLGADGVYRRAVYTYIFEPYGQMLGAYPAMEESSLMWQTSCEGWYGFLVEENAQTLRVWFDEYDGSDWDGGNLLAGHYVELTLEAPEKLEGGEADAV